MKETLKFPEGFLWGSATSSHQIEGNNHNDWSVWEKSPARIEALKKRGEDPQNYISGAACDSWSRFHEDVELLKRLGQRSYRFSIEWSRIEPEEGKINYEAINHYRSLAQLLCDAGIEPVITLWHFTNPVWFSEQGGWLNPKSPEKFQRFIKPVVDNLKDKVTYWATFNEADDIYAALAYYRGEWPPCERSILKSIKVVLNIIKAHHLAYREIHALYGGTDTQSHKNDTKSHNHIMRSGEASHNIATLRNDTSSRNVAVGIVENQRHFIPGKYLSGIQQNVVEYFRNHFLLNRVRTSLDFVGLNYYTIDRMFGSQSSLPKQDTMEHMGWEIYPPGIYHELMNLKYLGKPILITENGIADSTDAKREKFIKDHLIQVHNAIRDGVDVRGYFYWSLLDNFEWAKGYRPKFGLVEVDLKTFERKIRPSALEYAKICRENQLEIF